MTKTTTSERVLAELSEEDGRTAGESATATSLGQSTVGKALGAFESEGRVRRIVGGREGGRRIADRWLLAGKPASHVANGKPEGAKARLGRGELLDRVLAALRAAAQPIGPSALAGSLGHSSGAIANALERLVEADLARRVGDSPKRYRAVAKAGVK